MFDISFIRIAYIRPLISGSCSKYHLTPEQLGIPSSLYRDEMALVPHAVVNGWLTKIAELSGDPSYPLAIADSLAISSIDVKANWFMSAPDLAVTFRRINYGLSCFHSGAHYVGRQSGKLLKWCYDNEYSGTAAGIDSLRVAIMMTSVLRHFTHEGFAPLAVRLKGTDIDINAASEWFGCEVKTGCAMTEVWFDNKLLLLEHAVPRDHNKATLISLFDLDELVNMPQRDDPTKALYEVVNFTRHYGMPSLETVASTLGLSTQQLQRRLHRLGFSFSSMRGYVLNNIAARYMLKGYAPDEVARLLGYSNPQSFTKAFQRVRGCTPKEYMRRMEH
ncbi:AraC family transcriptional regulator [Grimontia sp. S25]|uniref:AraC family transcriptional regulator n=1 Tax=Grimontia sedimenti TaxID=2711294 RepID=A0A6M1RHN7_9GAMM|nr:AraC family transcriptional regulator [Grimontia sedimenti]NGN97128.1 AraC family transcriptional regulator [Grimontia sedimenti]